MNPIPARRKLVIFLLGGRRHQVSADTRCIKSNDEYIRSSEPEPIEINGKICQGNRRFGKIRGYVGRRGLSGSGRHSDAIKPISSESIDVFVVATGKLVLTRLDRLARLGEEASNPACVSY